MFTAFAHIISLVPWGSVDLIRLPSSLMAYGSQWLGHGWVLIVGGSN